MAANQYYGNQQGGPSYPQQSYGPPGGGPPGQGDKGMFNHGQQQYQQYPQQGGYGMQQPMQYGPPGGGQRELGFNDAPPSTDADDTFSRPCPPPHLYSIPVMMYNRFGRFIMFTPTTSTRIYFCILCAAIPAIQHTMVDSSPFTYNKDLLLRVVGAVDAALRAVVSLQDCEAIHIISVASYAEISLAQVSLRCML